VDYGTFLDPAAGLSNWQALTFLIEARTP